MKHTALLLTMSLAALTLASCSDDEPDITVHNGNSPAIAFRPAMGGLSRATETTNANLSSIYITSLLGDQDYFDQLEFTKGSDNFFTSAKEYYWPGDDTELTFYAYSPSADVLGADVTINKDTKELTSFVTPENIADQVDFISAKATGNREANETSGVPLVFDHRLAQIQINAKSANPNYTYKVAGVRIGRPQTTGTFDFDTEEWTLDDWHETAVYTSSTDEVTLTADPVSIMGKSGNAMLIPQTLTPWSPVNDPDNVAREAYLSVLVNISTNEGVQIYPFPSDKVKDENGNPRKYAWASIPLSGTWEQGKKYIYTLDFTDGAGNVDPDDPTPGEPVLGEPIKATVTVTDWVEADKAIPMDPVRK
ncbi:MAG: fimbrillin family protein [Muribaculaceae bacterium]|nr:fimbrillin family protein [Muribaculaceae bacterium]